MSRVDEFRAKLELIKESELDKQELDKDLRKDFIQAWYRSIDIIRPVFEVAMDVALDGLALREYPGKRDIALERKAKHTTYELKYSPNFHDCKVTIVIATPLGRRSESILIENILTETVETKVSAFVAETAYLLGRKR